MKYRQPLSHLLRYLLWAGLLVPFAAGCSTSNSKTATISGKVTYKGAPVTGGTILLHPTDNRPEYNITIKPDGSYDVSDVPTGQFGVSVSTAAIKNMGDPSMYQKGTGGSKLDLDTSSMPKYVQIPTKYTNVKTSGITWDVTKGKQVKNIELTD